MEFEPSNTKMSRRDLLQNLDIYALPELENFYEAWMVDLCQSLDIEVEDDEPSAARTESEKNVCNNCPNWTSSEASQNGLFAYDKQALFLRNSVLAELSVYGH